MLFTVSKHIPPEKSPDVAIGIVVKVVGTAEMIQSARPITGVRTGEEGTRTSDQSSSWVNKIEELD